MIGAEAVQRRDAERDFKGILAMDQPDSLPLRHFFVGGKRN